MLGGSRCISQHLRDSSFHCSARQFSTIFTASPPTSNSSFKNFRIRLRNKNSSSSCLSNKVSIFGVNCIRPKSSDTQSSVLSESLSQSGADEELPSERLPILAGGIVALGKFDALHIGHRELAIQAAKRGIPFLLSFVGMPEVLGWEPRAPIVAECDRKRILSSWAPYCGNVIPRELQIDFSKVRYLTPCQFVEKLSKELGIRGVVAGENYRFGYRASGDASDLVKLCEEYGLEAYIINSVMDTNQISGALNSHDGKERGQVSSTRVRYQFPMASQSDSTNSKKKDIGWTYVIQGPTKDSVICVFCKHTYNGGITRHKHHLMGEKKYVKACPSCPVEVTEEVRAFVENKAASIPKNQRYESADNIIDDDDDMNEYDEMMSPSKTQKMSSSGSASSTT